jgi:hypothetical protein
MRIHSPGSNDLISHTLRHFVRAGSRMHLLPPTRAMDREQALRHLDRAGANEGLCGSIPFHAKALKDQHHWWEPPLRAALLRIHDQGYRPRYLPIVLTSLLPDRQASRWGKDRQGRWSMVQEETSTLIAGDWHPVARRLVIKSAYRQEVFPGGRRDSKTSDSTLNDFVRKFRR